MGCVYDPAYLFVVLFVANAIAYFALFLPLWLQPGVYKITRSLNLTGLMNALLQSSTSYWPDDVASQLLLATLLTSLFFKVVSTNIDILLFFSSVMLLKPVMNHIVDTTQSFLDRSLGLQVSETVAIVTLLAVVATLVGVYYATSADVFVMNVFHMTTSSLSFFLSIRAMCVMMKNPRDPHMCCVNVATSYMLGSSDASNEDLCPLWWGLSQWMLLVTVLVVRYSIEYSYKKKPKPMESINGTPVTKGTRSLIPAPKDHASPVDETPLLRSSSRIHEPLPTHETISLLRLCKYCKHPLTAGHLCTR